VLFDVRALSELNRRQRRSIKGVARSLRVIDNSGILKEINAFIIERMPHGERISYRVVAGEKLCKGHENRRNTNRLYPKTALSRTFNGLFEVQFVYNFLIEQSTNEIHHFALSGMKFNHITVILRVFAKR
jgi:hypothetical protein